MLQFIKSFRAREDGAITVDWVVLTAAIVGLAIALIALIAAGATDKSTSVGAFLSSQEIVTH
ncbi:hypothetical protein SAMN05444287_0388 [Octadecabacter temperatus]|uniref:Uncharacterized protein n=1 Tax=Octadecabacter temperatus TaxID=1458307 RepID=A0A0K0Y331_9RHOB|nr:hypothetical protein [Octadecabacter temperatus]AKS45296.1 hypothetical protein OSB_07350 [Octadecabacter temperatus]SIN90007.1 hypothetical protein SAMN05444287_0388 [Octadecabacter temperatus]